MNNVVMTINGVDMTEKLLRSGAWSLNKRWSVETFAFTVRNYIFGPEAYRVPIGADVILHYRGDLMFGGQVQSIDEYRADDEGPVFVDVNCISYDLLAHQVLITGESQEARLHDVAYSFFLQFLAPKGCTWLGPVTESPMLPKMTYVRASLGEVFNRMTKHTNVPWRINGDRWFAFSVPGTLPLPMNPMRTHHFLSGVKIQQNYHEYGLRLILQTGGTGEAKHNETHTADGIKKYFMTNVEVRPDEVETDDAGVETTKTYAPTSFKLNGADTPFNGSPWNWNKYEHMAWTSGAPPAAGSTLRFEFDISFPAVVRIWKPELLLSDGQMNPALRIDKLIDVSFLTDVAETAAWGRVEIDRAGRTPRKLTGSTTIRGHYPYLTGRLSLPEHNCDANFLLQNVSIRDSDADPNLFEHLIYDLDFIEGDRAGRNWEDLFTESGGRGGQGGSIAVSGTGGSVGSPGPGTGEPGTGTIVAAYPVGFTYQLGGDNNEYIQLTDQWRDIPEMYLNKFGGPGATGYWNFKAFGYIINGALGNPILEIALFAGLDGQAASQIAVGTILTFGALMQGPWGTFDQPVTVPAALSNLVCRCRIAQVGATVNVVIGHCLMYKSQTGIRNES